MKFFKVLLLSLLSLNIFAVEVELVARANSYGSYNLPDTSYISNSTIKNNGKNSIAFSFVTIVEEEVHMGLWLRNDHYPKGETLHIAAVGNYVSDPSINEKGDMVFSVYNELELVGLYFYDFKDNKLEKILDSNGGEYVSLRDPLLNNSETILFGLTFKSGEKTVATLRNGKMSTIASNKEEDIAYLFGAAFYNGNQIALKVREGSSLADSQPDTIRIYKSSGRFSRINSDVDFDSNSIFSEFNNSLGAHFSSKYVAFVAKLTNGKRVLVRQLGDKVEIIATEGEGGISTLEYFAPSINEDGNIAFRAMNAQQKRAIFFFDGFVVREVLTEGDFVFSDQSTAVIHSSNGPAFGGSITINKSNEIVLQARIFTKYLDTALGTAVLKVTP